MKLNIQKLQQGKEIPTYRLPEINVYPDNRWGDIARSQGLQTARNWRKVKEGTTKGINDFVNDPRTQFVSMMLPLPQGLEHAGDFIGYLGKRGKQLFKSNKIASTLKTLFCEK